MDSQRAFDLARHGQADTKRKLEEDAIGGSDTRTHATIARPRPVTLIAIASSCS